MGRVGRLSSVRDIKPLFLGPGVFHTALGNLEETVEAIRAGHSGLGRDSDSPFAYGSDRTIHEEPGVSDRVFQLAKLCVAELETYLGCPFHRFGDTLRLVFSTTKGNVAHLVESPLEKGQPPYRDLYLWDTAQRLKESFSLASEPMVVSNACISGISALQVARYLMEREGAHHVLVVGVDEVSRFLLEGFGGLQCLSSDGCRPYGDPSLGMSLGDGGVAVLLTSDVNLARRSRGNVLEIAGLSINNDAEHLSSPSASGAQLTRAIGEAILQAGIQIEDIAFVNGHGTGTLYNDRMELLALAQAGCGALPLNALKGAIGHTLGASGLIELLICAWELEHQFALGTVGTSSMMEPAKGKLLLRGSSIHGNSCLKLGSGFGGSNAALILRRWEEDDKHEEEDPYPVSPLHSARLTASWDKRGRVDDGVLQELKAKYTALPSYSRFNRMSRHAQWGLLAVSELLSAAKGCLTGVDPAHVGVVLHSRSASLSVDAEHGRRIASGRVSPSIFPYTLGNAAISEICIANGFQGETIYFASGYPHDSVDGYARWLISSGRCSGVVSGWIEEYDGNYDLSLHLYLAE